MATTPGNYEKLGQFYLGCEYDAEKEARTEELVMYDSKDLVTHGVVLGMTGSGKTGLCLALLEEAAIDKVPAIVIDPKGDIANLLLTFPDLDAKSFRPWINEDDAQRKGMTPDDFATKTAATWKKGLADWGQDGVRIQALKEAADINIFTPGSSTGIPVSILSSLSVPPPEILDDAEILTARIESTAASLLSLAGVDTNAVQGDAEVLVSKIFEESWKAGKDVNIAGLIREIQKPKFNKVGVVDLESFMPVKARNALALKFNALIASSGFSAWLEGQPLDIAELLHDKGGKPRVSIFSIAHLDDPDRMFFVSLLLNQLVGWMRTQSGTNSLRALFYMDEIFGYLPPTANPPSKKPMLTLLKQARAFGVGCLLATQNPVDLDYKALSNIGSWFLGRLQTERDKMRVLDGLESAASSQNAGFDRAAMDKLLSGLGNRIFLLNNVHEDAPRLFQVRWAMSFLAGPLSREQVKTLMAPKRALFAKFSNAAKANAPSDGGMPGMPGLPAEEDAPQGGERPMVGAGVTEIFVDPAGGGEGITYQPHLLRMGTVHFYAARSGLDGSRVVKYVNPITPEAIDLQKNLPPPLNLDVKDTTPEDGASFAELPGFAMNAANYKAVAKSFADELYRNQRADLFYCEALKEWSKFEETEADFRARLQLKAREVRDGVIAKIRDAAAKKIGTLEDRRRTAQAQLDKQKAESNSAKLQAGVSVLGGILGAVLGKKSGLGSLTRGTSAITKGSAAWKQMQDVGAAEDKLGGVQADIDALNKQAELDIAAATANYDISALTMETDSVKPAKTDVKADLVALLWLPFDERGERAW